MLAARNGAITYDKLITKSADNENVMNNEFQRIKRLPPYVFQIVNDLKAQARARGEDIIDFGMGNPDQPTPQHIVDKMIEATGRPDTHRYSMSRGIPRLRQAICDWYQRRFSVDLDIDSEAINWHACVLRVR